MGKNLIVTPLRTFAFTATFLAGLGAPSGRAQSMGLTAGVTGTDLNRMAYFASSPLSSSSLPDDPSAVFAQEPSTPAVQEETEEARKARERAESEAQLRRQVHQRNFGIIPNFNTVLGGVVPPLTPGEKFRLVFHSTTDPYTFGIAFVVAGFGELNPPNQGYGWGAGGYFYRLATAYGDNVDGALWGNAILPVLLKQDPRYYRKGTGSIKSRILYSAVSTLICHGDNGHRQFNFSNVVGNLIAGGISNAYYPAEQRGIGLVFSNGLTVTAEGAIGAQLLEFAPDIQAALRRRRERKQAAKDLRAVPSAGVHEDE